MLVFGKPSCWIWKNTLSILSFTSSSSKSWWWKLRFHLYKQFLLIFQVVTTQQYWWQNSRFCHILETIFMNSGQNVVWWLLESLSFSRGCLQEARGFPVPSFCLYLSGSKQTCGKAFWVSWKISSLWFFKKIIFLPFLWVFCICAFCLLCWN